jgi:uncharacterized Zn finger protein
MTEKVRFRCRHCGESFVKEVFERGEAEAKRQQSYPIQCPECGSGDIERR